MEDLIKLKTALDLIVTGLYEKERQKKKGSIFTASVLFMELICFRV